MTPPYAITRAGLPWIGLPETIEGWESLLKERGLPVEVDVEPPVEEALMPGFMQTRKGYFGWRDACIEALHARSREKDPRYRLVIAVSAALIAARGFSSDAQFDWSAADGLDFSALAGFKPKEQVPLIAAELDRPDALRSDFLASFQTSADLEDYLLHKHSYNKGERPAVQGRLLDEERAWWARHAAELEFPDPKRR